MTHASSTCDVALTSADLRARGPLARLGRRVLCFHSVDSTQLALRRLAPQLPDGALALAEVQSAGRGRRERPWQAPPRSSVLLSALLRAAPASPLPALSTAAAALAACEAIERVTGMAAGLRWPNDVVIRDRKVAGVLAESCAALPREVTLILGVGINCRQRPDAFDPRWRSHATSLDIEARAPVDRAAVAAELVARLDHWLASPDTPDWSQRLWQAWRHRCRDEGRPATLVCGGATWRGTILSIDETGNLLVELADGERRRFVAATTQRIWEEPPS